MNTEVYCRVEQTEPGRNSCNSMTLPAKIWARKDLALVAAGSLSCLSALYAKAAAMGKLHQFSYCCISPLEYASGNSVLKIQEQLQRALDKKGCGGVILYASCMEMLTGLDFTGVKAALWNPKGIPVEMFRRGPMVTRHEAPGENLKKIMEAMPPEQTEMERTVDILPVPFPDAAAIARCLQSGRTYNFLMTAGGCGGCIPGEEGLDAYHLRKSRFHDLEAAGGCEEALQNSIFRDKQELGAGLPGCLMSSSVPRLLSIDGECMAKELTRRGEEFWYLPSDNFHMAAEGLSKAILRLGKHLLKRESCNLIQVNILGSHPLAAAKREHLEQGAALLEKKGFLPVFLDMEDWESWEQAGFGAFNWVTSIEWLPLAKWMEEVWEVPWLCGFPVGAKAASYLMSAIEKKLMREKEQPGAPKEQTREEKRIQALLLGEPVLTKGISDYIEQEFGWKKSRRAVYAPLASARRWYREHAPGEFVFLTEHACLKELLAGAEVVLADARFENAVKAIRPKIPFIPLAWPLELSGRGDEKRPPELFGKAGAAWLKGQLDNCSLPP